MTKEKKEIISVGQDIEKVEDFSDILSIAEKREKFIEKAIELGIKATTAHDWVDQNGKPYLTGSGAEKIARRFGVKVHGVECKRFNEKDNKGEYYYFRYTGTFELPGGLDSIEAIGICSSRDQFFAIITKKDVSGKPIYENGKPVKILKPLEEVDISNIEKSAYTNMLGNGITRLIGLRGLTWEQLAPYGITADKVSKVEYKNGKMKGGVISEPQRKRLFAISKKVGMNDDDLKDLLFFDFQLESTANIKRANYDKICKAVESWKPQRRPGEEG